MSANAQPDGPSLQVAEEILRKIYGDDFKGCNVSLESISTIVSDAFRQREAHVHELLELYEKLVEALHLLSTPPGADKLTDANELRTLLSERLDAVHALTTKTIETTLLAKKQESGDA